MEFKIRPWDISDLNGLVKYADNWENEWDDFHVRSGFLFFPLFDQLFLKKLLTKTLDIQMQSKELNRVFTEKGNAEQQHS